MKFEINNLTDHDDTVIKNYVTGIEYLEKDVYIELWRVSEFREYFEKANTPIINPLSGKKYPTRGFHFFEDDTHKIAMIYEPIYSARMNWKRVLIHELTHCRQCEKVGITLYLQLADIYENDRENDPFELQAYWEEEYGQ